LVATMARRSNVATCATRRGDHLEDHLPGEEDQEARDIEPVRKERAVARICPLLVADPADGQDQVLRFTGQKVPATRTPTPQQAHARRVATLDLGTVVRLGAGHGSPGLLFDPAKGRYVLVRAQEDAGLACSCLRRQ